MLTTGIDTLTGTSGNDTFIGSDTTLSAADMIVGGAGIDTVNYTHSAGAGLPAASMSGVEVLNVRAVAAVGSSDLSLYSGLTTFNSDRSNSAITVTKLASGGSFGIIGDGSVVNTTAANFGSVDAATAQTLNISGGTLGASAITLSGAGVLSTTVNSTGAANTVGAITAAATSTGLTINATSALTTGAITAAGVTGTALTIAGTANVTTDLNAVAATRLTVSNTTGAVVTGTLNAATVTVDASANTGGVTTKLGTSTAMVFTGGSGNDVVTAGATLGAGAAVNAGAGTDRIVFTANGQLTAASGAKYTNFEVLQSTAATDINMDHIAGITALRTSGNATFTNVTAAQAAAITTVASGALDIGVKDAATVGQLDTVSITTSSTNVAVAIAALAIADVETINLTANTGTGLTSITTLAHDDWATLNLSGASAITVTSTATAALINTAVNGSAATGVLTLDFAASSGNGIAITGGSANDVLTGSAQADVISGGAGNDKITGGMGADRMTGGAGADTFVFGIGATGTPSATNFDTITDFARASDIIDFAAALTIASGSTAGIAGIAAINAQGIASFNAADDTLLERITAAEAGINASGVAASGQFAVFEHSGSSYVFVSDGADGIAGGDVLIMLTGLTGIAATTLTAGGDLTFA